MFARWSSKDRARDKRGPRHIHHNLYLKQWVMTVFFLSGPGQECKLNQIRREIRNHGSLFPLRLVQDDPLLVRYIISGMAWVMRFRHYKIEAFRKMRVGFMKSQIDPRPPRMSTQVGSGGNFTRLFKNELLLRLR